MELEDFRRQMQSKGWVSFPEMVPPNELTRLKQELNAAYERRRPLRTADDGTLHHLLGDGDSFLELLRNEYLDRYISTFLGGKYILNSFGGVVLRKSVSSYTNKPHRDVRTFSRELKLMLNYLLMLDDFTLSNGATYLLSGSHLEAGHPEEREFFTRAERVVGKAGTIVLFDSNLWHAAGENQTEVDRLAMTLTFSRPFVKQQFDYPRYLGEDLCDRLPEKVQQSLGYHARTPATLEEWYRPRESRFYRDNQE